MRTFAFAFATFLAVSGLASATPTPNAASSVAEGSIHRLGPDARQLRFEGENGSRVWAIYVTAAQANSRARVRLSYSNAISVMPENSTLRISVNDVEVAKSPIAAASDPGAIDVELPRGLLTTGYNALRISVNQRHRVDCSLEATYELMTQVDPSTSGLTFPGVTDAGISTLDELASISPDSTGAVTIRVVLPENAATTEIDNAIRAVEATAIRARIIRPNVEIVNSIDSRPGLYVLVGDHANLNARGFGHFLDAGSGPRVISTGNPGQTVLVLAGESERETEAAIRALSPADGGDIPAATAPALLALKTSKGFAIDGPTHVSFHDLGLSSEEFDGRLYRANFDVMLPPDFYPADYDKLTFSLSYGYSPGLASNAQILVRVNEQEAGSMPMRNPHGGVFDGRSISVSLSALRPGLNRIQIEAQTPTSQDSACEPQSLLTAGKRFALFDRSELIVPSLARIAKLPNLAVTMSSGFPYVGANSGRLLIGRRDNTEIAAAASFLARTAYVAGRLIEMRSTFDAADVRSSSAVIVGEFRDFGADILQPFELDAQILRRAWGGPRAIESANAAATKTTATATAPGVDLHDQWAEGLETTTVDFGPRSSARAIYDRFINIHRNDLGWLRTPAATLDIPEHSTLLLAQTRSPGADPGAWTLLLAANGDELARDIHGLAAPTNWDRAEGRAVAFLPRAGLVTIPGLPESYFVSTQSFGPGNFRLIAAGWLSSNIDYYLVAFLLGALVLGALTTWTVKVFGARP